MSFARPLYTRNTSGGGVGPVGPSGPTGTTGPTGSRGPQGNSGGLLLYLNQNEPSGVSSYKLLSTDPSLNPITTTTNGLLSGVVASQFLTPPLTIIQEILPGPVNAYIYASSSAFDSYIRIEGFITNDNGPTEIPLFDVSTNLISSGSTTLYQAQGLIHTPQTVISGTTRVGIRLTVFGNGTSIVTISYQTLNAYSYISTTIPIQGPTGQTGSTGYTGYTGATGPSYWQAMGPTGIYYDEGPVAIGQNSGTYTLDVSGNARFTGGITGATGSFNNLFSSSNSILGQYSSSSNQLNEPWSQIYSINPTPIRTISKSTTGQYIVFNTELEIYLSINYGNSFSLVWFNTNPSATPIINNVSISSSGQYISFSNDGTYNQSGGAGVYYSNNYGQSFSDDFFGAGWQNVTLAGNTGYTYCSFWTGAQITVLNNTTGLTFQYTPPIAVNGYPGILSDSTGNTLLLYENSTIQKTTNGLIASPTWSTVTIIAPLISDYYLVDADDTLQYISVIGSVSSILGIYYSSNSGSSFSLGTGTSGLTFSGISVSNTGQYQIACINGGDVYFSSNYGQNWLLTAAPNASWTSIKIDQTGTIFNATTNDGYVYQALPVQIKPQTLVNGILTIDGTTDISGNLVVTNEIISQGYLVGATGSFTYLTTSETITAGGQISALSGITGPTGSFSYLAANNVNVNGDIITSGNVLAKGIVSFGADLNTSGNITFSGNFIGATGSFNDLALSNISAEGQSIILYDGGYATGSYGIGNPPTPLGQSFNVTSNCIFTGVALPVETGQFSITIAQTLTCSLYNFTNPGSSPSSVLIGTQKGTSVSKILNPGDTYIAFSFSSQNISLSGGSAYCFLVTNTSSSNLQPVSIYQKQGGQSSGGIASWRLNQTVASPLTCNAVNSFSTLAVITAATGNTTVTVKSDTTFTNPVTMFSDLDVSGNLTNLNSLGFSSSQSSLSPNFIIHAFSFTQTGISIAGGTGTAYNNIYYNSTDGTSGTQKHNFTSAPYIFLNIVSTTGVNEALISTSANTIITSPNTFTLGIHNFDTTTTLTTFTVQVLVIGY